MARRDDKHGKKQAPSARRRHSRPHITSSAIPPLVLRNVVGGDEGYANLIPPTEPSPLPPIRG
jgi:hypothetical protein